MVILVGSHTKVCCLVGTCILREKDPWKLICFTNPLNIGGNLKVRSVKIIRTLN